MVSPVAVDDLLVILEHQRHAVGLQFDAPQLSGAMMASLISSYWWVFGISPTIAWFRITRIRSHRRISSRMSLEISGIDLPFAARTQISSTSAFLAFMALPFAGSPMIRLS